jgi:hypothetical protein
MSARKPGRSADGTCRRILERICAEAGSPESSPFCREIARHIEECAKCRAQAISLRGTLQVYRCLERKEVPAEIARNLKKALGLDAIDP